MKVLEMTRDIFRPTVDRRDHARIGDGEDRFAVSMVSVSIPRVARESRAILDLLPIDCIAPRDASPAIDQENAAAVMIVRRIARSVGAAPTISLQRRQRN